MGRKSAAALAIVPATADLGISPPDSLSDEELRIWKAVVATKPPEWFKADSAPLLTEYVRAVVVCDRLADRISKGLDAGYGMELLGPWMSKRDVESRRVIALARTMRLTQQARYFPDKAATHDKRATGKSPWERSA